MMANKSINVRKTGTAILAILLAVLLIGMFIYNSYNKEDHKDHVESFPKQMITPPVERKNEGPQVPATLSAKSKDEAGLKKSKEAAKQGVINVKKFGAVGDGVTDDLPAMKKAVETALKTRYNIYIPKGKYMLSGHFPVGNRSGSDLLDYRNITIYGDGKSSLVFTKGISGIDVFQLNAVKNIHIKNIAISSVTTGSNYLHGSNAVSITNGGENIKVEQLYIEKLPFVKHEKYVDGGKGITIQPANTKNVVRNIFITECSVIDCAYGIGMDIDGRMLAANPPSNIRIESNNIQRCWRGISIGTSDARGLEKNFSNVKILLSKNVITNCKYGIFLGRVGNLKIIANSITRKRTTSANTLFSRYENRGDQEYYGIQARGLINSVIEGNVIDCADSNGELAIGTITSPVSKIQSSKGNQISKNTLVRTSKVKILDDKTTKRANNIKE